MSTQPELFKELSIAGQQFVNKARRAGTEVDRAALATHLRSTASAYIAQGGASEITDTMVSELVARVTTWCADVYRPRSMRGRNCAANEALFHHLRVRAYEWSKGQLAARRGRGAVDREALRAYLVGEVAAYRAVPGQAHEDDGHETMPDRIVGYSGAMNRKLGRKLKAELRLENARAGATVEARDEAMFAVGAVIDMERQWAEVDGREPRAFTMTELHERVRFQTVSGPGGSNVQRDTGITLSAVRGAVERLQGQPRRQRRIDALPHTARDLATVLDTETPSKAVTVLTTDSLAARLWAPAGNPAARRQQRRRLRLAAEAISDCHVNLHVKVEGDHVVVANAMRMPADVAAAVSAAITDNAVRHLQGGMMHRRQGVFGTEVGRDAIAMVRAATVEYGADDLSLLLKGYGLPEAARSVTNLEFNIGDRFLDGIDVVATELRALAVEDDPEWDQHAAGAYVLGENERTCRDRAEGPFQAWHVLTRSPAYRARVAGAENSAARHRIRQLAEIFAQVGHVSEIEPVFAAAAAVRPGRKRKPVAVPPPRPLDAQRPTKEAHTVPQPQAETFRATYVEPTRLSPDVLEHLEIHHRLNTIRPAAVSIVAIYLAVTDEDVAMTMGPDLPWHKQPEAAKGGLRRVLRVWDQKRYEAVRLLDADGKGAAKEAILTAGCALRDRPDAMGVAYANQVIASIYRGCQGVEKGPRMRPDLLMASELYAWLRTRPAPPAKVTRAA